jgi:hypothetical protein
MCKKLVCLLLVLGLAGIASAANVDWTGVGDGSTWENPYNWEEEPIPSGIYRLPNSADRAKLHDGPGASHFQVLSSAQTVGNIQSTYANVTTTIKNGASLTLVSGQYDMYTGAGDTITTTIDAGGSVTLTAGIFHIGRYHATSWNGDVVVNVSGSVTATSGGVTVGTRSMGTPGTGSGGSSTLNIYDGGVVTCDAFSMVPDSDNISKDADLRLYDTGKLVVQGITGLKYVTIRDYLEGGGLIFGDDVDGNAEIILDYINDEIIVQIPEPATIAMLGLGGLALIRRKR